MDGRLSTSTGGGATTVEEQRSRVMAVMPDAPSPGGVQDDPS